MFRIVLTFIKIPKCEMLAFKCDDVVVILHFVFYTLVLHPMPKW